MDRVTEYNSKIRNEDKKKEQKMCGDDTETWLPALPGAVGPAGGGDHGSGLYRQADAAEQAALQDAFGSGGGEISCAGEQRQCRRPGAETAGPRCRAWATWRRSCRNQPALMRRRTGCAGISMGSRR